MTVTALYFDIPGNPIPLMRHRDSWEKSFVNKKTGKMQTIRWKYNPQTKEMEKIKAYFRSKFPHPLMTEALIIDYIFHMPIAKTWSKKAKEAAIKGKLHHLKKPDTSNLIKFYEDCMTGTIYTDDSIIVRTNAFKLYSENPRTQIWVRTMTDQEKENKILRIIDEYGLHAE